MECKKARSLISDLIVGTLEETEERDLLGHLAGCPQCEKERTSLRDVISSLKSLPLPDPGERFWDTFPLRIEQEIKKRSEERVRESGSRRTPFRILDWLQPGRAAYAFASMVILIIVTVLLFYPRYSIKEGRVSEGKKVITVSAMPPVEEPLVEGGDMYPVQLEDLSDDQLNLLYSSLLSSEIPRREDRELTEERIGGSTSVDLSSELKDLDSYELRLLSRRLYLEYPEIQEKGAL